MPETLRTEIEIAAPQATVFAFLTDPDKIHRWIGPATVDPRPGGIYLVSVADRHAARGEFIEVVPVHRLVYSFGWEGRPEVPPGSSRIEIDLVEQGDGTLVRLTHSGLPNEQERAGHEKGWNHYLQRLATAAAGGDPGPDSPPD
ncbi:SRPBCC family protein [Geminicoccus flavidas]|uniref:SRPBCC family protein n=1 Tax=Geminicoccus flavidas TaxID=2506407 RepID=UPI001356FDCC|nr:SRPBCC family protein [Geminicoccus flavidas]